MNIKEKIMAIPLEFGHEEYSSRDLTAYEVRELCAEVAQEYVKELELAEKYNFEVIQEINAGLEQQLLAERAKLDALIAEIDAMMIPDNFTYQTLIHKSHVSAILDKWRTK